MNITITQFAGEIPAVAPRLLKPGYAKRAIGTKLKNGNIEAFRDPATVTPSLIVTIIKSLRLYRGTHWFQWSADVDMIRAPISGDTQDRVIYTGDGYPRITDAAIATTGGLMPSNSYRLGVPAPTGVPVLNITGTGDESQAVEYRSYVYTYVNSYGQEGPPSPASEVTPFVLGQALSVSGMSGAPTGAYNITAKRIYRVNSADETAEMQFAAEVAVGVSSWSDTVLAENLGEVLSTSTYDPPPDGMTGLIELPNGGAAGFHLNDVYLCEPYSCQAWPYIYSTHEPIVGLGAYGNSILVVTTGNPYVLTGDHPSNMAMERLEVSYPGSSKRGIVDLGYAVAFPSPDGLVVIGMDVAKNATEGMLTQEQWQALNPESMIGVAWDGKYVGFYDAGGANKGGFIVDPKKDFLVMLPLHATGAWCNPKNGKLYLATGATGNQSIVQFDAGNGFLPRTWESGVTVALAPTNLGAAQVLAEAYPVGFRLKVDGVEKFIQDVENQKPFRLPPGFVGRDFSATLTATGGAAITAVFLANTIGELAQV